MLSDITSDQHDSPRCGHCGVPLAGRFSPCPSCHRRPVDSFAARSAQPPRLKVPLDNPVPLNDRQPLFDTRLPARKIWSPSSRALVNRYDLAEEPVVAAPIHQRLRQPIVMSASVLVVTSAVYLGFIHSNDARVGTPIGVSGKVQTQGVKPLVVIPQKPSANVAVQKPTTVPAQKPTTTIAQKPPTAIAQKAPTAVAQKPPTTIAQKPTTAVAQKPTPVPAQNATTAVAQRPAATAAQQVATLRSAPVRSPPIPPPATSPPVPRRVTSIASIGPEAKRNPGGQPGNQPDKTRADVARHLKAARANLQENNLAATKARLAAAIAVQPANRDALNMRSTISVREQQRDALLNLARGCGYIARWSCVSHNASTALMIDSSSKEAQRLVSLATRETELHMPPPAEPATDPAPDPRDLTVHH